MTLVLRHAREFSIALHCACSMTFLATIVPIATRAEPTPLEAGWQVRQVADGFDFGNGHHGLGYDPISMDLFVTSRNTDTALPPGVHRYSVYRVTQSGVTTELHFEDVLSGGVPFSYLAFDPVVRIIYFNAGGDRPDNIRKLDEFGTVIESIPPPATTERFTGMAFGPDGHLYLNSFRFGQGSVLRYDDFDHSFTTVFPAVGFGLNKGLSFDLDGTAFVAGSNGLYKINTSGTVTTIAAIESGAWGSTFGDDSVFSTNNGNILRVVPDGSGISLFASGHAITSNILFADDSRLYALDAASIWEYSYVPEPPSGILVMSLGFLGCYLRHTKAPSTSVMGGI